MKPSPKPSERDGRQKERRIAIHRFELAPRGKNADTAPYSSGSRSAESSSRNSASPTISSRRSGCSRAATFAGVKQHIEAFGIRQPPTANATSRPRRRLGRHRKRQRIGNHHRIQRAEGRFPFLPIPLRQDHHMLAGATRQPVSNLWRMGRHSTFPPELTKLTFAWMRQASRDKTGKPGCCADRCATALLT